MVGCIIWLINFSGSLASIYSARTSASVEDVNKSTSKIIQNQQQNLQYIHNLLVQQHDINRDNLGKKYPFGYALYYTDKNEKEIHTFDDVTDLINIKLDWNSSSVNFLSDEITEVLLPSVISPRGRFSNLRIQFFRKTNKITPPRIILDIEDFKIITEMIINENHYVIGVIGFAKPDTV